MDYRKIVLHDAGGECVWLALVGCHRMKGRSSAVQIRRAFNQRGRIAGGAKTNNWSTRHSTKNSKAACSAKTIKHLPTSNRLRVVRILDLNPGKRVRAGLGFADDSLQVLLAHSKNRCPSPSRYNR